MMYPVLEPDDSNQHAHDHLRIFARAWLEGVSSGLPAQARMPDFMLECAAEAVIEMGEPLLVSTIARLLTDKAYFESHLPMPVETFRELCKENDFTGASFVFQWWHNPRHAADREKYTPKLLEFANLFSDENCKRWWQLPLSGRGR